MRKKNSGMAAALLVLTAVLPFTGCTKKVQREHEIIKETDPWYSSRKLSVVDSCGASDYESFHFEDRAVSVIGDLIVVEYWGGEGIFLDDFQTCLLDSDGNLLKKFKIEDEIPMSRKLFIAREGNGTVLYYTSKNQIWKADFNDDTLELENNRAINIGEEGVQFVSGAMCNNHAFIIGSKAGKNYLFVINGDELIFKDEINIVYETTPQVSLKDGVYQIRMDSLMFSFDPDKLELKTGGSADMSDFSRIGIDEVIGYDGRLYSMETDGIYADGELYLKYCDADCNIHQFMTADLVDVSEDSIALTIPSSSFLEYVPEIILLNREEKNPNAGKTVINAASYGETLDDMTGEAITQFNTENKDYFIRYENLMPDTDGEEEFDEKYEKEFREKIISSEAADIYFGIDLLWWFQREDYFVDLNKELNLDPDLYYTKITDSVARDGKLFYMPLSFVANGFWTEKANVRDGAVGFTYDEYKDFVKTVGNGADQMSEFFSRDEYFFMCFSMMNDTWFKDGKVNIANEQFESMCDFFVNNVPEDPKYSEEDVMYNAFEIEEDTSYGAYSFEMTTPDFFGYTIGKYREPVFVGLPTSDGRGPSAYITNSVSISAVSDLREPCIEFVKLLMSDDIQMMNTSNPINRKALKDLIDWHAEYSADEFERFGFTPEEQAENYRYYHPTPEMKQAYLDAMDKVQVVSATDPSIRAVVLEELKSCYSGQKDLKEVEATLEDRLTTLYSEKG